MSNKIERQVITNAVCSNCLSYLEYTGLCLYSSPLQYVHTCFYCEQKERLLKKYPYTTYLQTTSSKKTYVLHSEESDGSTDIIGIFDSPQPPVGALRNYYGEYQLINQQNTGLDDNIEWRQAIVDCEGDKVILTMYKKEI